MAEISDVNAAFDAAWEKVTAYQARVDEDYAESQRLLAEAQDKLGAQGAQLDALKTHMDESAAGLAEMDLNPEFPVVEPPPVEEPPVEEPPVEEPPVEEPPVEEPPA